MAYPRSANSFSEAALQYAKGLSCWFRDYLTAIKHGRLHPFTPLERKVREATRNEPWGPTGTMLNELAEASVDTNNCSVIFAVLIFRLNYPPEKWRNVYKALQVLEFVLKRGSEKHIEMARIEFLEPLESLQCFDSVGTDGRDNGVNVRIRSEAIKKLLTDEELLKQERAKLQKIHNKFKGYSRAELNDHEHSVDMTRSNSWGGSAPVRSDGSAQDVSTCQPSSSARKNAGEMKGVSLEDNKKNLEALKRILSRPENRTCADCGDQMPTWASINCGVFLCLRCSGIHRGLGVHISKVRSCTLDTWLPEQVEFLNQTGNHIANKYWEARLQPNERRLGHDALFHLFVQEKYAQKKFAAGAWPPVMRSVDTPLGATPSLRVLPSPKPAGQNPPRAAEDPKNDLLTFEDEATFESFGSVEQEEGPEEVEIAVEEVNNQTDPKSPLGFENSALFEQRSSFLKMRSQVDRDSTQNGRSSGSKQKNEDKNSSHDVIHTTVLDFDDLESISETMSLASSKNLMVTLEKTAPSTVRAQHVSPPPKSPLLPPQAPRPSPAPTQQNQKKTSVRQNPVVDFLDAPLSVLPTTGDEGIDALEDPFSFMSDLPPFTLAQENKTEIIADSQIQEPVESLNMKIIPEATVELSPVVQSTSVVGMKNEYVLPGKELDKNSSINLQDISRLDQLFVQQMEDFLQFGYLSGMQKNSFK